jgi:hypothetical protein
MAGLNFQQALQELATTPHTQADLKALLDRLSADYFQAARNLLVCNYHWQFYH